MSLGSAGLNPAKKAVLPQVLATVNTFLSAGPLKIGFLVQNVLACPGTTYGSDSGVSFYAWKRHIVMPSSKGSCRMGW
jgi:hypothetical protein